MAKLIFRDAEIARDAVMASQKKEIAELYQKWADEIEAKANYYARKTTPSSVVAERQMRELREMLRNSSHQVSNELFNKIKSNMYIVADEVVKSNAAWLAQFGFSEKGINAAFSRVPTQIVERLITGQIYESGWSLSKRIWGDNEETLKDLYQIVARGVAENKPIYQISKDLQSYVTPGAKKSWNPVIAMKNTQTGKIEYRRLYKGVVDYNAQRLARTLVQHSYQQSFIATTHKNPFVTKYIWHSNGSRPCPLCQDRDGQEFAKGDLPMDHPNGQCTMEPVIADDMIDQLADWFNSPDGTYPEIDEFAGNFGYVPDKKAASVILSHSDSYTGYLTDNVAKQFVEKFGITPNISSISADENDFTGLMSGAYAYVEPSDGSLHINPNIFKDEDTFYKTIGGRIRAYHPNATPESILAHEYGHNVSLGVDEKKIIDNAVAKYVDKYPKSAMDAFIPDYQYAAESISHYAVTTEHELFAEAFGDVYANGDKAQELSKWIVEEVQRSMK